MSGRIGVDMLALNQIPQLSELPRFDPSQFTLPGGPELSPLYLGLYLALGVVLLFVGRRLFWFTLGFAGFVAGLLALSHVELPASAPTWAPWAAALVFGLVGALLALFVQKVVVGAVGFVAGGLAALWTASAFAWPVDAWAESLGIGGWGWPLLFTVGGALLGMLAGYLFEAALVVLSALSGAALVVAATSFEARVDLILFPALALVGMLVQAGLTGSSAREADANKTGKRRRSRRRKALREPREAGPNDPPWED